jgi:hypothetical protein
MWWGIGHGLNLVVLGRHSTWVGRKMEMNMLKVVMWKAMVVTLQIKIYDPKPQVFVEVSQPNIVRNHFLTLIQLFYLFWLLDILQDIVNETNRYIAI